MTDTKKLEKMILNAIPDAEIQIEDLRGDGNHYAAYVSSALFAGKSRIEQHRMVYDALTEAIDGGLHAIAIQTSTKE